MGGRLVADGPVRAVLEQPPTEEVAAFVGFDGRLADGSNDVLRVRPADVLLDPAGTVGGVVRRRVPLEDGVRLELDVDAGRLVCVAPLPGPAVGDPVRVTLRGGVRYGAPTAGVPATVTQAQMPWTPCPAAPPGSASPT